MLSRAFNIAKARRWYEKRRLLRVADPARRLQILQSFGDEIRDLAPSFNRATTVDKDEIASALEVSSAYGVILGAWLNVDPTNPRWPGRDRFYVIRRDDLLNACAALSVSGFFPAETIPDLIEKVDIEGRKVVIPGLESPGTPVNEIPQLIWDSAVNSARDKKRWRETLGDSPLNNWLSPAWVDAPETWRTCIVLDIADPITQEFRDLANREGERPAGLVALVKAPRDIAATIVDEWWTSGWDTVLLDRSDVVQMHDVLTSVTLERPLALILSTGAVCANQPHFSKTFIRRRESGLLGEMTDEQFNALMGESLQI